MAERGQYGRWGVSDNVESPEDLEYVVARVAEQMAQMLARLMRAQERMSDVTDIAAGGVSVSTTVGSLDECPDLVLGGAER